MMLSLLSFNKWKDLSLPLVVVLVVGMIIFPLPSSLLDFLLAANVAFCVLLLLASLFIPEPDKFTSLPSVLLLSTLFRLGLNISSTRLILSGVEVPEIIVAFGEFVVSGSTIVGLVIFSIISIIQFIVIAKGSERVAEVAARFTLDALPGKQMSIDADMRAGLLSIPEAREKRRELHREAKLYGALDGAMKFIKGDAIVGLCIILVNIIAGILIGAIRDKMPIMDAVERYTLLTVGDGLVSQLPAVLVSIAASIVITRVSEKEGGILSDEILSQLTREPLILLVSSILIFCLALVPGLPTIPFLACSVIPFLLWRTERNKDIKSSLDKSNKIIPFKPRMLPPIVLKLSPKGALLLQEEKVITDYIDAIRENFYENLGILIPEVSFDINPHINDISANLIVFNQLRDNVVYVDNYQGNETLLATKQIDPFSRVVAKLLNNELSNTLIDFINDSHTRSLIEIYEVYSPDLIKGLIPDKMSVTTLTLILKQLVSENVSIRNFTVIMQSLSELHHQDNQEFNSINKSQDRLHLEGIKKVRERLISAKIMGLSKSDKIIKVFTLPIDIEENIITQTHAGLDMHPDISFYLRSEIEKLGDEVRGINLLTSSNIRTQVANTLKRYLSKMSVICHEEIPEGLSVVTLGALGLIENGEESEDTEHKETELRNAA